MQRMPSPAAATMRRAEVPRSSSNRRAGSGTLDASCHITASHAKKWHANGPTGTTDKACFLVDPPAWRTKLSRIETTSGCCNHKSAHPSALTLGTLVCPLQFTQGPDQTHPANDQQQRENCSQDCWAKAVDTRRPRRSKHHRRRSSL